MISTNETIGTAGDGDAAVVDDDLGHDAPVERLSWPRLGVLLAVIALIAVGGVALVRNATTATPVLTRSWSVPYVDVTLTPTYEFQDPDANPARDIALAFVVADPDDACSPSWGGAYSLEEASRDLELDRRVTQLRAAGGDIMVSFGGQANEELAYACSDVEALTDAYRAVVERYDVRVVDLDIENQDISDAPSIERRATALAVVQDEREAAGEDLAVWLTLPVATSGLTADGVALVAATLDGGVELAGVNAMTMNFSSAQDPTQDMLAATESALRATVAQVADVYAEQGVELDEAQRWARVGATPMIGQNDVDGEIFTLADAQGLATFAIANGLGRVSTWSLNRDQPCGDSFADVMILSNTCSSQPQEPLEYAKVFTTLPGRSPSQPEVESVTVVDRETITDDPATSPYPIWRPDAQYVEGYKVVRRGEVYRSKWYNQGSDPAIAATVEPSATPWSLVGPVDADDVAFALPTVAPGTHPDWDPSVLYAQGDQILLDGLAYEARWPNQGNVPPTLFPVGPDSPWVPLFTVPGEPTDP